MTCASDQVGSCALRVMPPQPRKIIESQGLSAMAAVGASGDDSNAIVDAFDAHLHQSSAAEVLKDAVDLLNQHAFQLVHRANGNSPIDEIKFRFSSTNSSSDDILA